jgi:hypothetical protein|tara:strand:+ start:3989 stop:4141 length:153 start_codon:yes stop_codon:yes gene_type:complete
MCTDQIMLDLKVGISVSEDAEFFSKAFYLLKHVHSEGKKKYRLLMNRSPG